MGCLLSTPAVKQSHPSNGDRIVTDGVGHPSSRAYAGNTAAPPTKAAEKSHVSSSDTPAAPTQPQPTPGDQQAAGRHAPHAAAPVNAAADTAGSLADAQRGNAPDQQCRRPQHTAYMAEKAAAPQGAQAQANHQQDLDPLQGLNTPYVKVRSLNAGAFGFVQHARHKETGSNVAIKFLERSCASDNNVERELLNHRALRHPHVIQFKEVFLTPQYICIVMELASEGSLLARVQNVGKLQESTARWFFQQLMVGVDYCHRKGVVNRDIKLDNSLLKANSKLELPLLKICDFGYSKDPLLSDPKSMVGTIAYMAPEVLAAQGRYDGAQADIWSCGIMLYVMLCERYPFDICTGAHLDATWSFPADIQLSAECRDLLQRMLVKDPQQRLTMSGIFAHPWFLEKLPKEALQMNEGLVGKEDYSGVQSEQEIRALLQEARDNPGAHLHQQDEDTLLDDDVLIEAVIADEMVQNQQSFDLRRSLHMPRVH